MRGDVYKFGCYRGTPLSALDRAIIAFEALTKRRFIDRLFAFVSFAGMPEAGTLGRLDGYELALGTLTPGQYACSVPEFRDALKTNGVALDRVEIIEGFFERSLRDSAVAERTANSRCAPLHIDCDFEVSACDALRFMTPRLQDGTVVLFDDWFLFRGRPDRGVRAAFERWLPTSGYTATPYDPYSWVSAAFILHARD
jgi:hypothetical protein